MRNGIGPWAGSPAKEAGCSHAARGRSAGSLPRYQKPGENHAKIASMGVRTWDCFGRDYGDQRSLASRPYGAAGRASGRRRAFVSRKLSSSRGEAIAIVGTVGDGAVAAGIGVVLLRGAAWAGVVRRDGTDGDGQATARSLGLRGQVGQESSGRDHSRNRSLAGADDIFVCRSPAATWHSSRSPPWP
ncbi:hypothetical protein ACVII1_007604 [Bradyrhizobium elkanii]